MYRGTTTAIHVLAATSGVALDHVCEALQHAFDTTAFRSGGGSRWNRGEVFSPSLHLNVTRDDSLSLRKDWYEAPSGTNYLITLTCGKADASDLLSHLSEVLEAALATQVRAVDAHRVVRAYWNRPVETRGDLGKLFESSSDAPGDESPGGWPLPLSWGLFLASVTGLFFLIRACVS